MNKYSIIVPVYNVEKYIGECLDSIKNQTYGEFEVILVDDGTPDNSGKICDEYAKADARFKVIHKDNGGLISAWKEGLRCARHELIMFVDSDDVIDTNILEILEEKADYTKADLFQFDRMTGKNTKSIQYGNIDDFRSVLFYYKGYNKIVKNSRCGKVFKKSKLLSILDDIDDRVEIGEDRLTTFCYLLNIERIGFLDFDGYYYRQHATSMTHRYNERFFEKTCILFDAVKSAISKYANGYDYSDQICKEKVIYAINIAANAFILKNKNNRRHVLAQIAADAEMQRGFQIIDRNDLSFYQNKMLDALIKDSYLRIAFWQFIRKIKRVIRGA